MKNNVKSLLLLVFMLFAQTVSVWSQNIDSLYSVFCNSKGEKHIIAANEIVKYAYENEHIDSLITLKTTDEQTFVNAIVYDAMGAYFMYEKENHEKSIFFFKLALENVEKIGNSTFINLLNNQIGSNYARMGDYENAVEYIMKCYKWEKSVDDSEGLSGTLNNLGVIYSQWQKPDMAIRFFEEAKEVERLLNRPLQYANRLAQLAKEYSHVDAEKALHLIKKALQYDLKIESQNLKEERIAVHNSTMGDIYYELDSLENAENCYKKSLTFFENNRRTYNFASALLGLGRLQLKAQKNTEAIATLKRCDEIAENNNFLRIQRDVCLLLSEAYRRVEPNSPSYFYLNKYFNLNDTIFRETTQKQINDFQVKYETAEKQLEIERQQVEIDKHKTRQIIYTGVLIATGLLLTLLVIIVIMRTRHNHELAKINAIKDKFFSIISHDLKNPAIAQREALQLLSDNADKWDSNTLSHYHKQLLKSANGLIDLLKNLLNWAQIQTGRQIYQPSKFNLVSALQSDISVIKSMAEQKNITFETLMPQVALITADENMLLTVVRNLLVNAVKFTANGGNVSLQILENHSKDGINSSSTHNVSVSDTGIGMTTEQIHNLFRIVRQKSREDTTGERGTGLGLIVCKELIEKHNSILYVESEEGKGSKFWFELKG